MNDLNFLTDGYDEKIKRVNEINAPLNFVFISDEHNRLNEFWPEFMAEQKTEKKYEFAADHIRSIQYILDRCPGISFVVNGGDVGNDYLPDAKMYKESVKAVYDELYKLSVPVHCVIGNHDDGLGNCFDRGYDYKTHTILPKEMHSLCMKYNPTDENYYYIDCEPGYRLIFMNSCDYPNMFDEDSNCPIGWRLEISDKQAKWFEREALNTDRQTIIISHAPLHNAGVFGTEGMPIGVKPFDDTLNAPRILYDISVKGNVIANICGHLHYDNIVYNKDYVTIATTCSLAQRWAPSMPERKLGTPAETAFDVYSFKDRLIYITRFGAGEDRIAEIRDRQPGIYY